MNTLYFVHIVSSLKTNLQDPEFFLPATIFIERFNIVEELFNYEYILRDGWYKRYTHIQRTIIYDIIKGLDKTDPNWFFVWECKLLVVIPSKNIIYAYTYRDSINDYCSILYNLYNKQLYPIFYSNPYYHADNVQALVQLYHYSVGIFIRLNEMWNEITPLNIDWNPKLSTMYYDSYSEIYTDSVYNLVDYTNAYGQRYNIQWDWDWYNSWLFELSHENISSWKRLNSWVIQPRRLSNVINDYLYPILNFSDIYDFENALDVSEKKVSAKMKFKSFRKHFYFLNTDIPQIYLKHRDYGQGPSYAVNHWWWNNFSNEHDLTSYRQQGLIFYWYEHFYSIEIPIKVLWANWYQSVVPTWMHTTISTWIPNEISWQTVTRPTHFVLKAWRWMAVTDSNDYTEDGDRLIERDELEEFIYNYHKMMWSYDPDFDYDNSYANELQRKKHEEFMDLKEMINTSKYVYKDPFADYYVPGNNNFN